jgi:hypothetical protein
VTASPPGEAFAKVVFYIDLCAIWQMFLNVDVVGIPRRKELTVVGVSSFSRGWGPPTNNKEGKQNNE